MARRDDQYREYLRELLHVASATPPTTKMT